MVMTMMSSSSGIGRNGDSDQSLWRWSQWLSNISERDAELLKQGPEYDGFLVAMERLEEAHIAILNSTITHHPIETTNSIIIAGQPRLFSLQNSLLFRIFDFLECRDLVNSAKCCHRFNFLSREMARLRTRDMIGDQLLSSRMQLLRAKEQIEGIATNASYRAVPIPILLPPRRIVVSHCGDDDCNGIYVCTAANGNGFEFTKHRFTDPAGRLVGNDVRPDFERRLRCRIGKRFSGQTILWYLSKDEASVLIGAGVDPPARTYLFWANLMPEEFAPVDLVHYPSFSSVLAQSEQAWQSLPVDHGGQPPQPPVVELLD